MAVAVEAPTVDSVKTALLKDFETKASALNAKKTGKGTRHRVGQTRGKSSKVIMWEAFDTDQAATLPVTPAEFMELTGVKEEPLLVSYLIDGFNSAAYASASDVLADYAEPNWPDTMVKQFKGAINNYIAATGVAIEDAVALMKPGIAAAFEKQLAAAKATQ